MLIYFKGIIIKFLMILYNFLNILLIKIIKFKMENNNVYNLINQMTQESKSLWRIKKSYIKEAKTKAMKDFWTKLAKDKEIHLKEIKNIIKTELK